MAKLVVGSTQAIRWRGGDPSWTVKIFLVDWVTCEAVAILAENLPNTGSFPCRWSTPGKFKICVETLGARDWTYSCDFEVGKKNINMLR